MSARQQYKAAILAGLVARPDERYFDGPLDDVAGLKAWREMLAREDVAFAASYADAALAEDAAHELKGEDVMSRTLPKPTVEELRSIAATYASSAEDRLGDSVNLKDADERDTSLALRREDLIIMCALEQWANALEGKGGAK